MAVSLHPGPFEVAAALRREPIPSVALSAVTTTMRSVVVTADHIASAPREWNSIRGEYTYSGFATPLAIALNERMGGRWTENETITPDCYGYADWLSQWAIRTPNSRLRFVTFGPDAYQWMADWAWDGPDAVKPATFTARFSEMRPLRAGCNSQMSEAAL